MLEIRKILYPTDFSRCAQQALNHALFLAERLEVELHMLHALVLPSGDPQERAFPGSREILQRMFEIADSELARLVDKQEREPLALRQVTEKGFHTATIVLEYARDQEIDLIIMGTHGRRGVRRLVLGSVAEEILRFATCPVMTLRERRQPATIESIGRILVPIDFSQHSRQALAYGRELARLYQAELQLLHVVEIRPFPDAYGAGAWSPPLERLRGIAQVALEELAAENETGVPWQTHVRSGRPGSEIATFARHHGSGMIVIATHGLTGLEHLLLGSTTEEVVRTAHCPVFTVRRPSSAEIERTAGS